MTRRNPGIVTAQPRAALLALACLTAAACRKSAAMIMTDGKKTYCTPVVEVENTAPGKVGLWLYQIGERQEYDDFEVSRAEFAPVRREIKGWPDPAAAHQGQGRAKAKELPLVLHENPGILPAVKVPEVTFLPGEEYKPPRLPAPQDWVLVLERMKP